MLLRQLFDPDSCTYTYLVGDEVTGKAVLIDPVFELHERDAALVRELGLSLEYTLDTHCHADHVTGAWRMREAFGSRIVLSGRVGAEHVDQPVDDGDEVRFGDKRLEVRATPGHTDGCVTYVTEGHTHAFTGDTLLIRGAGRTDFQQGDASTMYRSIRQQLFTLPDACFVMPAHDYSGRTVSTIGEERAYNARIGGDADERDFVGYMDNLGLPHPRKLAVALPANLRCGRPEHDATEGCGWGPVRRTFAGILEIDAEWVAAHLDDVLVLDVRGPGEADEGLGQIAGAVTIPLGELRERCGELPSDRPIVTVCHAGKRSAMGTTILTRAGHGRVANIGGGMVRWNLLSLPVD